MLIMREKISQNKYKMLDFAYNDYERCKMLVQFSVENFQSIREKICLDLRKVNINEHKDSLIQNEYLPISVIYGPNGGGKSTVLQALNMFCAMITTPLFQMGTLKLPFVGIIQKPAPIPFLLDDDSRKKPTVFELVVHLGESDYKLYMECTGALIVYECLQEKKSVGKIITLYERNSTTLTVGDKLKVSVPKTAIIAADMPALSYLRQLYGISPIKEITDWMMASPTIDYGTPAMEEMLKATLLLHAQNPQLKATMKNMLKYLNLDIDDFDMNVINNNNANQQLQIVTYHNVNNKRYNLFLQQESMGTQKLFNLLPYIIDSLNRGGVLMIDELDAKLHPKMLERVISLYTDKKYNKNSAQLLFTSHDLSTMNKRIFRRDEIWFAAKDQSENTMLYSLSDIRDENGELIRTDASYSKQYLAGRYGADPYFEKIQNWRL